MKASLPINKAALTAAGLGGTALRADQGALLFGAGYEPSGLCQPSTINSE